MPLPKGGMPVPSVVSVIATPPTLSDRRTAATVPTSARAPSASMTRWRPAESMSVTTKSLGRDHETCRGGQLQGIRFWPRRDDGAERREWGDGTEVATAELRAVGDQHACRGCGDHRAL